MSNRAVAAGVGLARVMAHCGGSAEAAVDYLSGAIASAPQHPDPYTVIGELWRDNRSELAGAIQNASSLRTVLAQSYISFLENNMDGAALAIGSVTGVRPDIAWAEAPWFGDERFLSAVSAEALAEAAMRTMDRGHDLDTESMRTRFQPWVRAIETVSNRDPQPEALAKMAILLRACGLADASFALCDRADSVEPIMLTEVVRAGTWRKLGDPDQTVAAFERALALEPDNWSLYLDLADVRVEQGDFSSAIQLIDRGLEHEPTDLALRAAGAAYRTRLTGSPAALRELIEVAPQLPNDAYRNLLINHACAAPDLPDQLVADARRAQTIT